MKWLLVMVMAASVADLATTEVALGRGYHVELNPLMRNQAIRTVSHLLVPPVIYWASKRSPRRHRILWCVVASSVWASLATHNLYIMYTHPL